MRQGASKASAAKTSGRSGAECTQLFRQALQQAMQLLLTQRGIGPQRVGDVLGVEVAGAPCHSMICQGLQELSPRVVVHLGKRPHQIGWGAGGVALAVLCWAGSAAEGGQAVQVAWTCWAWELGTLLGRHTKSARTEVGRKAGTARDMLLHVGCMDLTAATCQARAVGCQAQAKRLSSACTANVMIADKVLNICTGHEAQAFKEQSAAGSPIMLFRCSNSGFLAMSAMSSGCMCCSLIMVPILCMAVAMQTLSNWALLLRMTAKMSCSTGATAISG